MNCLDKIPPNEFALLAALLGILLNFELDVNEQNAFGNFLVSVGQTMLTAAAQSANIEAHPTKASLCQKVEKMSADLEDLKKQLTCSK